MPTIILIDECRTCPMHRGETKDTVRCNRLEGLIVVAHIMPFYSIDNEKMIQVVHCNKNPRKLKINIK